MLLKIMFLKNVYDSLVAKVNNIDTSEFLLKTKCQTDKAELDNKILILLKKQSSLHQQIKFQTLVVATKSALTAVENKIPDASSLVKKTDYDTKIVEHKNKISDHNHDKYITIPQFNTSAARVFNARFNNKQANLITKIDFNTKLSSLN